MYLPPHCQRVTPRLASSREWEPEGTDFVLRSLKRGDVFVDVGAHAGYYTLVASRAVGDPGHVYAFEPEPRNHAFLQRNLELNGLRNVTLERRAVANATGARKLYLSETNTGDHRLFRSGDERCLDIDAVSLDDYFPARRRVDFVKVDTQGAEVLVLGGMRRTLRSNPGARLLVEFWPFGLRGCGSSGGELLSLLTAYGFAVPNVIGLLSACTIENRRHANLCLEPARFRGAA